MWLQDAAALCCTKVLASLSKVGRPESKRMLRDSAVLRILQAACHYGHGGQLEESAGQALAAAAATEGSLRADGLAISAPGGASLLEDVSFEWRCGDRIVLSGPPGSGKSTLLRVLAGAWPPPLRGALGPSPRGSGVLLLTSAGFLLPHRASLRRSLAYPDVISPFDDELQDALVRCGLAALTARLDEEADWASVLSLGDRQRLAFARLLSRWPSGLRWLLLDEVDDALDGNEAASLHELLSAAAPSGVGLVVTSRHAEVRSGLATGGTLTPTPRRHFHVHCLGQTPSVCALKDRTAEPDS